MSKRKTIFINPQFQYKLIGHFLAITLCVCVIIWIANLYFIRKLMMLGQDLNLPTNHPFYQFVGGLRADLNLTFIVVSLISGVVIVGVGAILSHRIAGPIHALNKHLKENQDSPLKFRQNDFFPEICDNLNPILEELRERRKS
jgi:signal peptidase II